MFTNSIFFSYEWLSSSNQFLVFILFQLVLNVIFITSHFKVFNSTTTFSSLTIPIVFFFFLLIIAIVLVFILITSVVFLLTTLSIAFLLILLISSITKFSIFRFFLPPIFKIFNELLKTLLLFPLLQVL